MSNRWYGKIGFEDSVETSPGIWSGIKVCNYYGNVLSYDRSLQLSDSVNGKVTISAKISIVADEYAQNHFHLMKYIEFMGANWDVSRVEVQHPRLILTLGGEYNGEQA